MAKERRAAGDAAADEFVRSFSSRDETKESLASDLRQTMGAIAQLHEDAQATVSALRNLGVSWREIGELTGVTGQAASQRWSEAGRARNRENQRRLRARSFGEQEPIEHPSDRINVIRDIIASWRLRGDELAMPDEAIGLLSIRMPRATRRELEAILVQLMTHAAAYDVPLDRALVQRLVARPNITAY